MSAQPTNNRLEYTIVQAKLGKEPMTNLVRELVSSTLSVPSAQEVTADGAGFLPLFFDKNGVGMLAAFTDKSRVTLLGDKVRYCIEMKGIDLLRRIPKEYGLVLNPGGTDVGIDIAPAGIASIVRDFG